MALPLQNQEAVPEADTEVKSSAETAQLGLFLEELVSGGSSPPQHDPCPVRRWIGSAFVCRLRFGQLFLSSTI